MRFPWPALATVLLAAGAPLATGFHAQPLPDGDLLDVRIDPDPVPPGTPVAVHARVRDPASVERATLKVCLSEGRNATLCHLPVPMTLAGDTFSGRAPEPLPGEQEFGFNLSFVLKDGSERHYPDVPGHGPANAYVFSRTATELRTPPGIAGMVPGTLLVLALAALAARARR